MKTIIIEELKKIGSLLDQAKLIDTVYKEVHAAIKDHPVSVLGGEFSENPEYDVVVKHKEGMECSELIKRRLGKKLANIEIKNLDTLVDNIIGIRFQIKSKGRRK